MTALHHLDSHVGGSVALKGLAGLDEASLQRPEAQILLRRMIAAASASDMVAMAERSPMAAAGLYQTWLDANGAREDAWPIWFNLAVHLTATQDMAGARVAATAALRLKPDLWQAAVAASQAAEAAGDRPGAIAQLRQVLLNAEGRMNLHRQLGRMLELEKRLSEAAEEMRAALLIDPAQPALIQHLVHVRQKMVAWPVTQLDVPGLSQEMAELHCGPLATLALHDDPAMQARVAAAWIDQHVPDPGIRLAPPAGYSHDRLRIGYLSSDFCRHAMSFLIAELLECHDRSRFEIIGYCASPEDGSAERARVLAALDRHVPIRALSDEEAARCIRRDEIDILIDLNGLTSGARPGILRWKPAPVQATYLGFIGPVPIPELDWLICDDITVPEAEAAHYRPAPLRIAGCYQANDSHKPMLPNVTRQQEGLPEAGFVFACASHFYKITAPVFAAWCQIVAAVPGSVLWLVEDTLEGQMALSARWQAAGLAAERLIFAPRVDPAHYRARLALADLFLDTLPYNGGTIASDALRMGLPVLTMTGRTFSGRMAASLLTAVGFPEGIASDIEDYVARAIDFATGRRALLRGAALAEAWERTLGDAAGFASRFEKALEQIALRPQI